MQDINAEAMIMVEDYADLAESLSKANIELAAINRQRTKKMEERTGLEVRMAAIRKDFENLTGRDIKKYLRPASAEAVDRAIGALFAAMCNPGNMPISDPVVQRRLADLRDAVNARTAEKEARRAARDAEKIETT